MHKQFATVFSKEPSEGKGNKLEARTAGSHTYPLCTEALGSLLVFTSIMSRERRKKNTAMAKLIR